MRVYSHTARSDETVEVGAKLYEIDTDATASTDDQPKSEETKKATVETSSKEATSETSPKEAAVEKTPKEEPAKKSTPPPKAKSAKKEPAPKTTTTARTPSIHFLGKEGWATRLSGQTTNQPVYIPPMYGRPKFTEEEMNALITGGADLAPSVLDYSRGAKFRPI